jgi:hypothetical protein
MNFRDVLGVGYHFNDWSIGVRYIHYSNGGWMNPIFGTDDNQGYDWVAIHIKHKF